MKMKSLNRITLSFLLGLCLLLPVGYVTAAPSLPVNAETFGFSCAQSAANNATGLRKAIASGALRLSVSKPCNYALDNTIPLELNVAGMHFEVAAGVNILPSVNASKVFLITAANVIFEGGTITGDGTYTDTGSTAGRPIAFIEVYNGASPTAAQNVKIRNVTIVNPNNTGILFYRTVGGEVTNGKISSTYSGTWIQGVWGISVYSSAKILIEGNTINGGVEGLVGGAEPGHLFNDFAGEVAGKDTRQVIINNNRITNFRDHGIYYSNDASHITVTTNSITSAVVGSGEAIKLTGSCTIIGNHTISLRAAVAGRSMYNSVISGNVFQVTIVSTGVSANDSIIYLEGYAPWAQNVENISITNNVLIASGKIANGIYIYGAQRTAGASIGAQNIIKNLIISGNNFSGGIGGDPLEPYPAGIKLFQQKNSTAASTVYGENISITNNNMKLDSNSSYGIIMSGLPGMANYDKVIISGNNIYNVKSVGMYLGVRNALVENNLIKPSIPSIGVKEVTEADTPSGYNYFGKLLMADADISGGKFILVSEKR